MNYLILNIFNIQNSQGSQLIISPITLLQVYFNYFATRIPIGRLSLKIIV